MTAVSLLLSEIDTFAPSKFQCMSFGRKALSVWSLVLCGFTAFSQDTAKSHKNHSIYFSWGYNQEWYTRSTVHVEQGGLGNSYDMNSVNAHDHMGWNNGIFNKALTIPQYNYRLGYYFNEKQDLGIELNFDHTKYIIADPQRVHITGKLGNRAVDTLVLFSQSNGFYYFLNNGANFFLFNLVKRIGLYRSTSNDFALDAVGKAGVGPVIPHTQNMLFGQANDPGFQYGGWNTGLETVVRATFLRHAFIEFSQKVDYARYSGLHIYGGEAKQSFGTYELILSGGIFLPTTKNHPFFTHRHTAAPTDGK